MPISDSWFASACNLQSTDRWVGWHFSGVAECRRLFPNQQLVVLWLGSSIGNLSPAEAVQFFQDMTASAGTNIQVRAELEELQSRAAVEHFAMAKIFAHD